MCTAYLDFKSAKVCHVGWIKKAGKWEFLFQVTQTRPMSPFSQGFEADALEKKVC